MRRPDPNDPEDVKVAFASPAGWGWFVTNGIYQIYRHVEFWDGEILSAFAGQYDLLLEGHPRVGKSMLVSRFLAGWHMGRCPDKTVMHASWKVDMSKRWGRQIMRDLDRFGALVFNVELDVRREEEITMAGHEGGFIATGATGGVQGKPADLMITDDMVKGSEVTRSDVQLDNLADFCLTDLETRREDGCVHISIETPWHEDDPHGQWQKTFPNRYRRIALPAIAEEGDPLGREVGEALCPERISLERLEEIRDNRPSVWNALYMCRPTAAEGGIWKLAWWEGRTFEEVERNGERWVECFDGYSIPINNMTRFVVVDTATTEKETGDADYTAIMCCGLTTESPRRLCLLDLDLRRMEGPDINPAVKRMLKRWGARIAYYEVQGNQKMGWQYAKREGIAARTIGTANTSDVKIAGDKVAVAHDASGVAASGRLLVPAHAEWVAEWEHQMLVFPNGSHDDAEDVTAWACLIADRFTGMSLLSGSSGRNGTAVQGSDSDHPLHRRVTEADERRRKRRPVGAARRRGDVLDEWGPEAP